ncbi:hypothetical protein PENTCL1PPCAC_1136, partial [Pristionchus entomophagus]
RRSRRRGEEGRWTGGTDRNLLVVVPLAIDPVIDTRVEEGAEVERGEGNGVGRGIGDVLRLAIDTEGEVDRRVEIGEEAGVRAEIVDVAEGIHPPVHPEDRRLIEDERRGVKGRVPLIEPSLPPILTGAGHLGCQRRASAFHSLIDE